MNETDNNNNNLSFHLFDMKFIFEYRVPNTKSADAFQLFRIKCELNAFCLKMFNEFFVLFDVRIIFSFWLFCTVATVCIRRHFVEWSEPDSYHNGFKYFLLWRIVCSFRKDLSKAFGRQAICNKFIK